MQINVCSAISLKDTDLLIELQKVHVHFKLLSNLFLKYGSIWNSLNKFTLAMANKYYLISSKFICPSHESY